MNLPCGVCSLGCCGCNCCSQISSVTGDNCFKCNYAALKKQLEGLDTEIVYANFSNKLYQTPYFIAIDNEKHAIIISVRGTLSLEDCLTDVTASEDRFTIDAVDFYSHKGILQAAQYVKTDIETTGILDKLMSEENYSLILTGHSLGAGTASLLAILLKPQYPNLQCFAFSPPGLLNLEGSSYCNKFITSIIVGKDMIPRLCKASLHALRDSMILAVARSKTPKCCIFTRYCCCGTPGNALMWDEDSTKGQEAETLLRDYKESIVKEFGDVQTRHLYPPGKIIHLLKKKKTGCCSGEDVFRALWTKPKDFSSIIVSPAMMLDHMPDQVMKALKNTTIRTKSEFRHVN